MPVVGKAVTAAILTASPTLKGLVWFQMASGIGSAIAQWVRIPSNVVLAGSVNGTIGAGAVVGKFFMIPVPLPVAATVAASGLFGLLAPQMAAGVGLGVGIALNASAAYRGTATGAIGVDVSKVVFVNPISLIALITSNLAARQIRGPVAAQLAIGIGNGVSAMVATGGGTGVAAGVPGPSPGTGLSRSSLF